jgi:hypothetical protein
MLYIFATRSEKCGCSSVGRASPCQGEGRGFESRHPLIAQGSLLPFLLFAQVVE